MLFILCKFSYKIIGNLHVVVQGSANPEEHMMYVWDNFVKKCPAKIIDVVAHSYGGVVMVHWVRSSIHSNSFTICHFSLFSSTVTHLHERKSTKLHSLTLSTACTEKEPVKRQPIGSLRYLPHLQLTNI